MANDKSGKECKEVILSWLFDVVCSGPACVIIIILAFLNKRASGKRPALVIPVDILGGQLKNRWSIAVAFSTMLSTTTGLLFQQKFLFLRSEDSELSDTYSLLNLILTVLLYFVVYYPYLACLTSQHHLIASVLGFCYVSVRFVIIMINTFGCWQYLKYSVEEFRYLRLLLELPVIVFSGFLFTRFAFMASYYTWKKCRRKREEDGWVKIVDVSTVNYVRRLLNPFKSSVIQERRYTNCFSCTTGFKFCSTTLATVLVSILLVYHATLVLIRQVLRLTLLKFHPFDVIVRIPVVVSLSLSALITCGMLLHFMVSHRSNMLRMFRGDKAFLPEDLGPPSHIVGRSLRFCGYQVASAGWGTLAMGTFISIIAVLVVAAVHYWEVALSPRVLGIIKYLAFFVVLPFVGYYFVVWAIIKLLARLVFRDHSFPDKVLGINNRNLFNVSVFFFYFHTIIMGVLAVLARVFTGMLLGIFFLSRTDRNLMIQGFHNSDRGYASYIGYLHVLAAHRNPVRVVFCQILYDLIYKQRVVINKGISTAGSCLYPRESTRAFNRWHLAVMLLRNPWLQKSRKTLVQFPRGRLQIDESFVVAGEEKEIASCKGSVINNDETFLLEQLDKDYVDSKDNILHC